MNDFELFWREESGHYELRKLGVVIGTLPDDTEFANKVMRAFVDQAAYTSLRGRIERLGDDMQRFAKDIDRRWPR